MYIQCKVKAYRKCLDTVTGQRFLYIFFKYTNSPPEGDNYFCIVNIVYVLGGHKNCVQNNSIILYNYTEN